MLRSPRRDDTAVTLGRIEYLAEPVERKDALTLWTLIEETLKPPKVKAVHAPGMPEVPINVQLRSKLHSDTDAVKGVVMPLVGVEIATEWKSPTAPREHVITTGVLPEQSQAALHIGLKRPNDCLKGFIHGHCERRLTSSLSAARTCA